MRECLDTIRARAFEQFTNEFRAECNRSITSVERKFFETTEDPISEYDNMLNAHLRIEERVYNAIWCHSFAGGSNCLSSPNNSHQVWSLGQRFPEDQPTLQQYDNGDCQYPPHQVTCQQSSNYDGNSQGYQNPSYNPVYPSSLNNANVCGTNVLNSSGYHKLPSSPESLANSPPNSIVPALSLTGARTDSVQTQPPCYPCPKNSHVGARQFAATVTTPPSWTNTRNIATLLESAANTLYDEHSPSLGFRNKTEFHDVCPEERQRSCGGSSSLSRFTNPSASYNTTSNTLKILPNANVGDSACVDGNSFLKEYPVRTVSATREGQQKLQQSQTEPVVPSYRLNETDIVLERGLELKEGPAIDANVAGTIVTRNRGNFKQQSFCAGRSTGDASLVKHAALPHYLGTISPTSNIVAEMKYETQSGPPTAPPHLTSSGVEPPHSSQSTGIAVGSSPGEIDSLLLPWNGSEFLEGGVTDAKQTTVGFQDNWDSLLGTTVTEQLPEVKMIPLPPFTNYTGHLQINGIPGHHYHTIASSGQRSSIEVGSASPTPSSNQEFFESPVVSSSTPCPQASQKQPQGQQQQQNHQSSQHHHSHNQQQQQLPQSTQQINYDMGDMEDIAQIIGSAIADTTVPGNGNGPSSEQDTDASRDWIDIADWITDCSPKTQETTSPSTFASQQIYVTTTPSTPLPQHAGSALQNLLSQKLEYAPLLQARLQAGNATNLQNTSCGETPSSTSPFPPLSPPNRVSTSCSPDDILHSSFVPPSHPRKRSRSSPGSGGQPSKKGPTAGATPLPYGTDSGLMSGKDKPVHRCHICQRGFLNKSNIKVHLRTHTGEKPFRCDVCNKAFRQKAHLIKHQQIHKRIGRD